jgi:hypothetical protein
MADELIKPNKLFFNNTLAIIKIPVLAFAV